MPLTPCLPPSPLTDCITAASGTSSSAHGLGLLVRCIERSSKHCFPGTDPSQRVVPTCSTAVRGIGTVRRDGEIVAGELESSASTEQVRCRPPFRAPDLRSGD